MIWTILRWASEFLGSKSFLTTEFRGLFFALWFEIYIVNKYSKSCSVHHFSDRITCIMKCPDRAGTIFYMGQSLGRC